MIPLARPTEVEFIEAKGTKADTEQPTATNDPALSPPDTDQEDNRTASEPVNTTTGEDTGSHSQSTQHPEDDDTETVLMSNKRNLKRFFKRLGLIVLVLLVLTGLTRWVINHLSPLLLVPVAIILAGAIFVAVLLRCSVKLKKEEKDILPTGGTWYFLKQLANLFGREWHPAYVSKTDYATFYRLKAEEEEEQARLLAEAEKEQVRLAAEAEKQRDLDDYENALDNAIFAESEGETYNLTIANGKGGGGKTPLAALTALCLAIVTREVVTAIDNNPYGGNLSIWLGASKRPKGTVRWMSTQINDKKVNKFTNFSSIVSRNGEGVKLVDSDALKGTDSYGADETRSVVGVVRENSPFVVSDTSNNIGGVAVNALVAESDVLILAGFLREDKLNGVIETMRNFVVDHGPLVKHAVSVAIALKPGETAEDYRDRMELPPEATLVGIPYDERLERFRAIDFAALSQETRIAVKELVLVLIRVANHVKLNGRDVAPLTFTQGQLVPIPSGRTPVLSYTLNLPEADPESPPKATPASPPC